MSPVVGHLQAEQLTDVMVCACVCTFYCLCSFSLTVYVNTHISILSFGFAHDPPTGLFLSARLEPDVG